METGFTEVEWKEALDFLDFSFKLEKGLSSLRASYFNIACLDILSVFAYALFFNTDGAGYFAFGMLVRPIRGFIGFYLFLTVPRTD